MLGTLSTVAGPGRSRLAYATTGSGRYDLLLVPDGLLPVSSLAGFPPYAAFLERLANLGRLIVFDRRGLGESSWDWTMGHPGLADWADDARRVLDAARSPRAVVIGLAEGAMTAITFATAYPNRVAALVLVNATPGPSLSAVARRGVGPGYIGFLRSTLTGGWAKDLPGMDILAPSLGRDPTFSVWFHQAIRRIGDPTRFAPVFDAALRGEVRGGLRSLGAPTLVIHRRDDAWFAPDHGRLIARAIPRARYLELPGADHVPYLGETGPIFAAIRSFLDEMLVLEGGRRADDDPSPLTARQAEILELVGRGLSDKEVARATGLSVRTVQKHLEDTYRRLGVANRMSAVVQYRARRRPARRA